jgi:membrane-associated phospholipid phosphatase
MIDRYWTTILLAVLTSYVLYPFFPLTPPRVLFHDLPYRDKYFALRRLNEGLLRFNGDQPSLFPSGHVAGVTATALAVCALLPRAGIAFLIAAASVAIATVVGRYHYAVDALAGALVRHGCPSYLQKTCEAMVTLTLFSSGEGRVILLKKLRACQGSARSA